jgi:hypothetical protein
MTERQSKASFNDWQPPWPPRVRTADGAERCSGVELEMIELSVDEAGGIVARHVRGAQRERRPATST